MMRKVITVIALLIVGVMNSSPVLATDQDKALVGNWTYSVTDAPMGYENGKIVFSKKEGKFEAKIHRSDGFVIQAEKVNVTKSKIILEVMVEYELISIVLVFKNDKLEGKVSTSEYELAILMEKEN